MGREGSSEIRVGWVKPTDVSSTIGGFHPPYDYRLFR
jgi:hypothetical protein